jgi:hypothetical protein
MRILKHSHLLDKFLVPAAAASGPAGPDAYEKIQKLGGDLFEELVRNLDRQVGFDHPHFVAALSRVLHVYLPVKVNEKLGDDEKIGAAAFQRRIEEDVILRGQLVKCLLCLEDDEADVRAELTATLAGIAAAKDDQVFHAAEETRAVQIRKLLEAPHDLKAGLLNRSSEVKDYLVQQAGPWVDDINLSGDYAFDHPATGTGNGLLDIYGAAKASADWVARFIRTDPMHSFLFCRLASKYQAHKMAGLKGAAKRMFEVGIAGQERLGTRAYAQSRRDVRGYMDLIDQKAAEVAKKAKKEARPYLAVVKEQVKLLFLPANAYTREKQLERASRLFVTACQMAGGRVEELLKLSKKLREELNQPQQPLLRRFSEQSREAKTKSDAETVITVEAAKAALKQEVPGRADFIEKAFAGLPAETNARELKARFVEMLSEEVLQGFSTDFDASYAQILEEQAVLRRLFGLWCGVALESRGAFAGSTFPVNVLALSAELRGSAKHESALKTKQTEALKKRAVAGKERVESRVPEPVAAALQPRLAAGEPVHARVLNGEVEVATVAVEGDKLTIERNPDTDAVKPSAVSDPGNLKLVLPSAEDGTAVEFSVVNLKEMPINEAFPRTCPAARKRSRRPRTSTAAPPLAVYLTAQTGPTAQALTALSGHLSGLVGNPLAKGLQFPAVFLAPGTAAPPAGLKFPGVSADAAPLPNIEPVVGPGRIQNPPQLPWAASLLAADGCNFGRLAAGARPMQLAAALTRLNLPTWDVRSQSVHQYLRATWEYVAKTGGRLADQIMLLMWKNAAILGNIPLKDWPLWLREAVAAVYGGDEAAGPAVYAQVFAGLPFGQSAVEVEVEHAPGAALAALSAVPGAAPAGKVVINKRVVEAPWV